MNTFSKADLDRIFLENCVLIGERDAMPYLTAVNIFGGGAADFARRYGGSKAAGVYSNTFYTADDPDEYTEQYNAYLTYKGVQVAATYYNLKQLKQAEEQREGQKTVAIAFKPQRHRKANTGRRTQQ